MTDPGPACNARGSCSTRPSGVVDTPLRVARRIVSCGRDLLPLNGSKRDECLCELVGRAQP